MAATLSFSVSDQQEHDRQQRLSALLQDELRLRPADGLTSCDLLIVHRKTDFLPRARREEFLHQQGSLYVEYTGAAVPWKVEAERYYSGSSAELEARLRSLRPPVSAQALRHALESTPSPENLTALALLCQGYLAAHATWDEQAGACGPPDLAPALRQMGLEALLGSDRPLAERLLSDLGQKKAQVCERGWWLEVFEFPAAAAVEEGRWRAFRQALGNEWGPTQALPERLEALLTALHDDARLDRPGLVAAAYCELAARLGGQPCPPP